MAAPPDFRLTSEDSWPSDALFGFAFDGADIVLGMSGLEAFESKRSRSLQFGEDGSYILLRSRRASLEIGTDYTGYAQIFLYRSGTRWALASSFYDVLTLAAEKGWPITINKTHLASFFLPKAFGAQLVSLGTSVQEISLVPAHMLCRIADSSLQLVPRPTSATRAPISYAAAMEGFLTEWIGRLATLLRSGARLTCDISGGLDSRAVLALLLKAGELIGNPGLSGVYFLSNRSHEADFSTAQSLMDKMQLSNEDQPNPFSSDRLAAESSYAFWRSRSLGSYAPIYFSSRQRCSDFFWLGGEGGESNRVFYRARNLQDFVTRSLSHLPPEIGVSELSEEILRDTHRIEQDLGTTVPALMLHYRSFRERFHGGRRSALHNAISPLAGKRLKAAVDLSTGTQQDSGQIIYDIMRNSSPALILHPFDKATKPHGQTVLDAALTLRVSSAQITLDGQIFGNPPPSGEEAPRFRQKDVLDHMVGDMEHHRSFASQLNFFPSGFEKHVMDTLHRAAENGRFSNILETNAVSHFMLGGLLGRISQGH